MNTHSKLSTKASKPQLWIGLAILAVLVITVPAPAQRGTGSGAPEVGNAHVKIRQIVIKDVPASSGQQMFAAYCAVCHGAQGNGDGRAASALTVKPTDLTLLSANNRGKFPSVRVQHLLTYEPPYGRESTEMPNWCRAFHSLDRHATGSTILRAYSLASYLETLQVPYPKTTQAKLN